MRKKSHSPEKSLSNTNDKDKPKDLFFTQLKILFRYLQNNTSTASMVSQATGIPQKNITRYKKDLEKKGLIREVERQNCEITGFKAWYLTTKLDFVNSNKNLESIRKEERESENFRGHNYSNYI